MEYEDLDFGDYEYDIVPTGYAGLGDMAYSVVPALDEFGLGYGDLGDYAGPQRHKLGPKGRRALRRFRRRMRRANAAKRRATLNRLRARQRRIKSRVATGAPLRKKRYALLVRKIKALRRIMRRPIRARRRRVGPRAYRPIRPRVTPYFPIRPRVANYAPIVPPQQSYAPIDTATSVYAPIRPAVTQYAPAPMASAPGASESPVVRIRQSAGSQAPVEVDFEEEDFELEGGADPDAAAAAAEDAEEALDGYGDFGKPFAGKFGGVVATKKNYIRLRKRYFRLRRKLKKGGSQVLKGPLKATYKKLRNIEKKNAYQIAKRRRKGKKPFAWQGRLARYIKKVGGIRSKLAAIKGKRKPPPPPKKGAPPPPPGAVGIIGYIRRMKRKGWRKPPRNFLRGRPTRFRWRMWNRNTRRARAIRRAYFASRRRRFAPIRPRYIPIPRPVPQYTPIRPYVPQYAPIRTPGPMFAPIVPPMQQYVPAPRPIPRTYAPVGTETPYSYTYTTARAQPAISQAASQAARRAVQNAEVANEVADDAQADEQEGIGLGKIALGIGIVGAGAYFVSKGKKGKKGKKKKPANGRV